MNKSNYKFKVLNIIILLFATSVYANSINTEALNDIYRKDIAVKGEGVWETTSYVFFTVDQPCVRSGYKYSANREKKAATLKLMKLFVSHLNEQSYFQNINIPDILKNDVLKRIKIEQRGFENQLSMKGVMVANEDTGNCNRRISKAFVKTEYLQYIEKLNEINIDDLIIEAKKTLISSHDYKKLSDYFTFYQLFEPSIVFAIANELPIENLLSTISDQSSSIKKNKTSSKINKLIDLYKNNSSCIYVCNRNLEPIPNLDITNIMYRINSYHGFASYTESTIEQQQVAIKYINSALINFEKRSNAEQIIRDLSIGLLFDQDNVNAWNNMGSVLRALDLNEHALLAHTQALVLAPKKAETYIHLAKTYLQLNNEKIHNNYFKFIKDHYQWLEQDSWSDEQLANL